MLYTLQRMTAREAVPAGERSMPFRNLLRTSSFFNKLAGGSHSKETCQHLRQDARSTRIAEREDQV
jgi:hypothetical protein